MIADYFGVLLRAIETAKNDPVQFRSVIYELARISLRNQILTRAHLVSDRDGMRQHLLELEAAINYIEALSSLHTRILAPPSQKQTAGVIDSKDHTALADKQSQQLAVYEPIYESDDGTRWRDDRGLVIHRTSNRDYEGKLVPALSDSAEVVTVAPLSKRLWIAAWPMLQLVIAAVLGVAIYVAAVGRSDQTTVLRPSPSQQAGQTFTAPGKSEVEPSKLAEAEKLPGHRDEDAARAPGFPLPKVYGVYALSNGKLIELQSLPIRVPDQRIAISAMISTPSRTILPDGKLAFVVFRRDLVMNAPERATIRVVARVVRDMKFNGTAAPTISKIDHAWAVRSNLHEFRVAPVGNSQEMVVIRPENPDFALPAGRYALVLGGQGYDFSVEGAITDTTHCLERTEALNGTIYSECRAL